MSTSYYIKNKQNRELNDILNKIKHYNTRKAAYEEYYKEEKIGQTSMGWLFMIDGVSSLQELHDKMQGKVIVDEYGQHHTIEEVFELIENWSKFKTQSKNYPNYFTKVEEIFDGKRYVYDLFKDGEN